MNPEFLSDNGAGLCPEAVDAIVTTRSGRATAYGDDPDTARAEAALVELFGQDTAVFFVATGTAANTLALASLAPPWGRILCEEFAHVANDESTGPELQTGCRVVTIAAGGRKLTPDDIIRRDASLGRGVHHPAPGVVTISNTTEFGEVYTPTELRVLADAAHGLGYRLHVDGARFANAVAALGVEARQLAGDAGVDAMTFGGTKNGLALGEAVLFFGAEAQAEAVERFPYLRKRAGHLLSKHRYVTAPFAAVVESGAWLENATHANAMAARLAAAFMEVGVAPRFPTDANAVFVSLPDDLAAGLTERGWGFHRWTHPDWQVARFMTSFDTKPAVVEQLADDIRALAGGGSGAGTGR